MAACALATLASPARAAEIGLSNRPGCLFELHGTIVSGDAERFRALVAQAWTGDGEGFSDNSDRALCLDSPGGSFEEGHEISVEVHERAIATRITAGAGCVSACALVFMAGRNRGSEHDGKRRILHVTGRLGFHAPFTQLEDDRQLTGAAVNAFVPTLTGIIAEFIRQASFRSVFQERPSVSLGLLAEMLATPQNEMFMIDTVERAARWGVDLDGLGAPPQFSWAEYAQLCMNELAWIYDKGAKRITAEQLSYLDTKSYRKDLYGQPTDIAEIVEAGLSNRSCQIEVLAPGADGVGFCLEDGYTGIGIGQCDRTVDAYAGWVDWWHAMQPDMPLAALQ